MSADKKNVYQIVTDNILALLDKGIVPWRKPWKSAFSWPMSARGHLYRGINVFLLNASAMTKGYASPIWLTYKQANEFGGRVKEGEKSTLVTFWKLMEVDAEDKNGNPTKKRIPLLRFYLVFNYEQTHDVKLPKKAQEAHDKAIEASKNNTSPEAAIEAAETIVVGYEDAPKFSERDGAQARYNMGLDSIVVAKRENFDTIEDFYATLFHEFGHSTGHEKRLNRQGIAQFDHFGSGQYAEEELVAEMTSAFLTGEAGISTTIENTAAYIANWRTKLANDPKLIVQVAGKAQKAADFILGKKFEQKESE